MCKASLALLEMLGQYSGEAKILTNLKANSRDYFTILSLYA